MPLGHWLKSFKILVIPPRKVNLQWIHMNFMHSYPTPQRQSLAKLLKYIHRTEQGRRLHGSESIHTDCLSFSIVLILDAQLIEPKFSGSLSSRCFICRWYKIQTLALPWLQLHYSSTLVSTFGWSPWCWPQWIFPEQPHQPLLRWGWWSLGKSDRKCWYCDHRGRSMVL